MNKQQTITEKRKSQTEDLTTVTYHFANGTTQVAQITPESHFDEYGRKRNIQSFDKLFAETAHDLGAISFSR